jgi:hypothetical protein
MITSDPRPEERIVGVEIDDVQITLFLADGRSVSSPLVWYPRLLAATLDQRQNFQISGGGHGLHWPELDEDLSCAGMLRGTHAPNTD